MQFSENLLSPQYSRLKELGHTRPVPVFGASTLVMYVSIWPKRGSERHEIHDILSKHVTGSDGVRDGFVAGREVYSKRYEDFISVVKKTVKKLQDRGSINESANHVELQWSNPPLGYPSEWEEQEWFKPFANPIGPKDRERGFDRNKKEKYWWFPQLEEESIAFTITWFPDSQPPKGPVQPDTIKKAEETDSCARVRVHVEVYPEHINLGFYMELEGKEQPVNPSFIGKLREAINHFTDGAARRLENKDITEAPLTDGPTPDDINHAETLFNTAWSEFFKDFGINFAGDLEKGARVFNSHRGVIISANGYDVGANIGDPGTVRSNRFGEPPQRKPYSKYEEPPKADSKGREWVTEPLAVTKAHWNVIRCLGEVPTQREFVASKIYGGRAIFVSPLGSVIQKSDAEGQTIKPDDHNRFVIITCGKPNRETCGRLTERLMSIVVAKAMALRDWALVADSSEQAIVRGQQLDTIVEHWVREKNRLSQELLVLEDDLHPLKKAEREKQEGDFAVDARSLAKKTGHFVAKRVFGLERPGRRNWEDKWKHLQPIWSIEEEITNLSFKLSRHMIKCDNLLGRLMQEVNVIGQLSSGGLPYRLFKSQLYANECQRLLNSLDSQPMDGWMSLEQSFRRGVETVFETVSLVRDRMDALRRRIQLITEMVQIGASFEQQRKTSENTDEIRKISRNSELQLLRIERDLQSKATSEWLGRLLTLAGTFGFLVSWFQKNGLGDAWPAIFAALIVVGLIFWFPRKTKIPQLEL